MKKRKKWKPYLVCILTVLLMMEISIRVQAEGTPENLYARSAVLMDADTGRILFGKNDNEVMPMQKISMNECIRPVRPRS